MLLVPSMGMYGAALATMIVHVISWLACYIFAQRYYPIPYELSKVGKVFVVGTILYLIGILFNETAIGISILVKLVILGGYPFLLYKWHFYDKDASFTNSNSRTRLPPLREMSPKSCVVS